MKPAVLGGVVALVAVVLLVVWRMRRPTGASAGKADENAVALKLPISTSRIDGFTVTELLTAGPFSSMYKGRASDGAMVCIKLPARTSLQDADELKRFEREAQMLEGVDHRNVMRLVARGQVDERGVKVPYMVLEPLDGLDLKAFIAERAPLAVPETLTILGQIAEALDLIHGRGIIHRNLGPEAIHVTRDGRVIVHSFGAARAATMQTITMQNQVVGSVEFMAPEQMAGRKIDGKVDLYALGVVAYQLLTGKSPFVHANIAALMKQKSEIEGPHPNTVNPRIPPELDRLVSSLLSADPARRPASASRLVRDLAALR